MKSILLAALLLTAPTLIAQSVAVAPCGTIVAHDRVIELIGCPTVTWNTEGVLHDGPIVLDAERGDRAAVIDSLSSAVKVVDLATGKARTFTTSETPTGGAFIHGQLFVLARDANVVERIAEDGTRAFVATGSDAQLRVNNGMLYVYSRLEGRLQEIAPEPFAVTRTVDIPPFAADYVVDTLFLYFIYPADAMLRTYAIETLESAGEGTLGAVPMDIELAGDPNLLTARVVAIADPSSRRIWMLEGSQTHAKAVLRNILRRILGVGVYAGQSRDFPVGVDRLLASDKSAVAFDSSSGTLYQIVAKKKSRRLATGVAPRAFAVTDEAAFWWDGHKLQKADF